MNVFNFNREEILKKIKQVNNGICVEIGVFKGEYSKKILEQNPKKLYMIDIWEPVEKNYDDLTNNKNHPDAYSEALKIAKLYSNKTITIKKDSIEAALNFKDESIDFLYIDANHAYDFIKKDIEIWYPKVKKGGIFGGHDYLKINWKEDENFEENQKDKSIFEEQSCRIVTKTKEKESVKYGIFGVNPAVDEFCEKYNYELNITNDFFANWWVIKK